MDNPYDSATPEQKLSILAAELLTPIEIIRGFAYIIKKDIETNNINPDTMLELLIKLSKRQSGLKKCATMY